MFWFNMLLFVFNVIRCENELLVYNKIVFLVSIVIYKKINVCDVFCFYVIIVDILWLEIFSGLYNFYLFFKMMSVLLGKKIIIYK